MLSLLVFVVSAWRLFAFLHIFVYFFVSLCYNRFVRKIREFMRNFRIVYLPDELVGKVYFSNRAPSQGLNLQGWDDRRRIR